MKYLLVASLLLLQGCQNPVEPRAKDSCLVHMVATKNIHGDYEIYINEEKFITLVADFDGRFIVP